MEARIFRAVVLAAALAISAGASYRTPNFAVQTQSPEFAKRLGDAAEQYRRQLAIDWLGHTLPDWSQPCPMTVHVGEQLGAGGATSFVFDRGEVFGWRMTIQGPPDRLLDSVLPHEITHMLFASHFRQPLPRWADEGGATSVEHAHELARHRNMLVQFLKSNRGIAFNRMFAMTEYPRDVMPLYAQGYSLAEFLIQQGGRRKYVEFLGDGLKSGRWSDAIRRHYGAADTGTLQDTWLAWVKQGSPTLAPRADQTTAAPKPEAVAAAARLPRPAPNLIYHTGGQGRGAAEEKLVPIRREVRPGPEPWPSARTIAASTASSPKMLPASGWHAAGERPAPGTTQAAAALPPEPLRLQTAHPQPVEKARQMTLESLGR